MNEKVNKEKRIKIKIKVIIKRKEYFKITNTRKKHIKNNNLNKNRK